MTRKVNHHEVISQDQTATLSLNAPSPGDDLESKLMQCSEAIEIINFVIDEVEQGYLSDYLIEVLPFIMAGYIESDSFGQMNGGQRKLMFDGYNELRSFLDIIERNAIKLNEFKKAQV